MSDASPGDLARAVLQLYPRTFSEELGVRSLDTPSGSFRLLVMALLMSARIRASIALDAARALFRRRCTTAPRMAGFTKKLSRARLSTGLCIKEI